MAMDVPFWGWAAVIGGIVVLLAVDLLAHRRPHAIGLREAAVWTAVWVACGTGFGVVVWAVFGSQAGQQYFAGYLIEKSLSVDNVFVWAVLLTYFAVPAPTSTRCCSWASSGRWCCAAPSSPRARR